MTTQEKNKIIAEFRGGVKWLNKLACYWFEIPPTEHASYWYAELQYHASWDWLIPVIKICKQKLKSTEHINSHSKGHVLMANINNELLRLDLLNAHDCVCKFIQWYNNQQKQ